MVERLVNKAVSYLGAKEPTGDDQFIREYNKIARAGFSMNVAWCAIFVTVVARRVGISTQVIPTFANCDTGVRWYKSKNRYELAKAYGGTYVPKVGDVVFYSNKYTQKDSTHVGYVVEVNGSSIKAIEGNKGNAVAYRTIKMSNKYITGYGRVAQFLSSSESRDKKTKGLCSVAEFQEWLNKKFGKQIRSCPACGNQLLVVDDKFGPKTKAAATVAYQVTCNKKFNARLAVDGRFGKKSRAYGGKAVVKKGKKGTFVYIVQGVMCGYGCYPGEFDGSAGRILQAGIKSYQGMNGLVRDGKCGGKTYYSALR